MSQRKSATITEARLFIDRATVTRRLEVEPGTRTVVFEPLPLEIELGTLRARAARVEGGRTVPVPVHGASTHAVERDQTAARRDVDARVRAADAELASLRDRAETEERAARWLEQYAGITTATLSAEWLERNPSFDKWGESLDHLRAAWTKSAAVSAEVKKAQEEILRRKADLLARRATLGRSEQLGWRVEVEIEAQDAPVIVDLYTTTRAAKWMPVYDARLERTKEGKETLGLEAFALVKNATGEDWEDVRLVATTARPKLAAPPPDLRRIVVGASARAAARDLTLDERQVERLRAGVAGGPPSGEDEIEHVAPGRVRVPATGNPVRVRLFGAKLEAKTQLEIAPAERTVGSSVAESANTSGKVLLPGDVTIFRDGNYAGRASIGFVVPGQRFRVPVGHDASIRVVRRVVQAPREHRLTGGAVERFSNTLTVENPGRERVRLLLRDRLLVSRAEDVTVKVLARAPGLVIEDETGVATLEVELAPREKRVIELLSWSVAVPAGFDLPVPERL